MAENDQNNEEFKFEGFDSLNEPGMGDMGADSEGMAYAKDQSSHEKKDVMRNALIVLGVVVSVMVLYKVAQFAFFSKEEKVEATITPVVQTAPKVEAKPIQQVQQAPVVSKPATLETELSQKVSAIELSQDIVKSQVNSVNDKVNGVGTSIEQLNAQVNKLNQTIELLTTQLNKQSNEINSLMRKMRPQPVKQATRPKTEPLVYYVQAAIPGRAWLIASNGSTLTVGTGSSIPGYGMVRLIDSTQGKVVTSSGRIIRFSQEDS